MKQLKFKVDEFYKGEWQPCIVNHKGNKVQSIVKITQEEADANNIYKNEYGLRYTLDDSVKKVEKVVKTDPKSILVEEYVELFGKRPFGAWDINEIQQRINEELSK